MTQPCDADKEAGTICKGPPGFVTFRSVMAHGRRIVWRARQHRKGLLRDPREAATLPWHSPTYNRCMAAFFAMGSLLFMLGASLSLIPTSLSATQIAIVFFAGSIPFTIGGFLQNLQAANTGDFSTSAPPAAPRMQLIGWRPHNLGWLSAFTQFCGTIAFNFNTFDAIDARSAWYVQDIMIWVPGMIGSVLFLVSAYLAFMETSHGLWSWKPAALDWWIVTVNLLGCIFFMTAALTSFVPATQVPHWLDDVVNIHLWLGACCFFIAALLTIRESRQIETLDTISV